MIEQGQREQGRRQSPQCFARWKARRLMIKDLADPKS
jgi:hypothetical protein